MSISTPSQRSAAYQARFGTAHPTRAQIMAWARELFPELTMLRLKTVGGRTALMDHRDVLGVGTDPVEAVASADIARKQASLKTEAQPPKETPMSPETDQPLNLSESKESPLDKLVPFPPPDQPTASMEDIRAIMARINRATGAVNEILMKAPGMLSHDAEEIKELNLSVILANQLVGTPLKPLPVPDSIPEAVNPKPGTGTSDPKQLAQALS